MHSQSKTRPNAGFPFGDEFRPHPIMAKDHLLHFVAVAGAFFPEMMREAIKDSMAAAGKLVRKIESPAPDQ